MAAGAAKHIVPVRVFPKTEKNVPGKKNPAAKRAFSRPDYSFLDNFSQFPLSLFTLGLIGSGSLIRQS
jgi:hypothetical protein